MSQQEPHHEQGTGHELDVMPNRRLFNLLTSLTALTLLACIGLVAFFYDQAEALFLQRAKEGSFRVREYQEEVKEVAEGYGPTGDGRHFFVPHEKAKELVLADPSRFKAAPPPPGWIHPDDLQGGGARGAGKEVPAAAPGGQTASESNVGAAGPSGAAQAAAGEGEVTGNEPAGSAQPAAAGGDPREGGVDPSSRAGGGADGDRPEDRAPRSGMEKAPKSTQEAAPGAKGQQPGRPPGGAGRGARTESKGPKSGSNSPAGE